MKKGRHRRFEEARSLKRSVATANRRCPECGAEPDDKHASWCLATEDDYDEILGTAPKDARHSPRTTPWPSRDAGSAAAPGGGVSGAPSGGAAASTRARGAVRWSR